MSKHTPTPWEYTIKMQKHQFQAWIKASGKNIFKGNYYANEKENAQFIVQAVNSHQAMKEALGEALRAIKMIDGYKQDFDQQWLEQVHQNGIKALTLANGKESKE